MLKIRESLLAQEKESYADDNTIIPEDAIDCTQGCNPYGFYPTLLDVVRESDEQAIYAYPHYQGIYKGIIELCKPFVDIKKENIFLADGSIGALYAVNNIFETPKARALSVAPTFSDATNDYKMRGINYRYVEMPRSNNYKFDVSAVLSEMTTEDSVLYIDSPNNPTGQVICLDDIEKILVDAKKKDIAVIIDEAYGDFVPMEESAVRFLDKYDNLIIIRTFSKGFGMAAMRGGYVISSPYIIKTMSKMSNPYCMTEITRKVATEALAHPEFTTAHMEDFAKCKKMIRAAIGNKIHMAETDDRVPICLLYHEDLQINLAKQLAEAGCIAVDGSDFDTLNASSVRLRMPTIDKIDKVITAVKKVAIIK